jgi:hypothetical protein
LEETLALVAGPFGNQLPVSFRQPRFHLPLIEPDGRISRIRLSDGIREAAHATARCRSFTAVARSFRRVRNHLLEVIDNMVTLLILPRFQTAPEVRPLPSTGVTRLPRYYEPVRHPRRPGLSLAGIRLAVTRRHRWGFPCSVFLLCLRAVALTPVGPLGAYIVRYPSDIGLPQSATGSAPTLGFSRFAQRSLTLRPTDSQSRLSDPLHQRLWQFRYLHCHSDCYRLER